MPSSQTTIIVDSTQGIRFESTEHNPLAILGILSVVSGMLVKSLTESRIVTPPTRSIVS